MTATTVRTFTYTSWATGESVTLTDPASTASAIDTTKYVTTVYTATEPDGDFEVVQKSTTTLAETLSWQAATYAGTTQTVVNSDELHWSNVLSATTLTPSPLPAPDCRLPSTLTFASCQTEWESWASNAATPFVTLPTRSVTPGTPSAR